MRLVVAPPALAELHDAAAFYTLRGNVELGLAFVVEFERTPNLVLANPLLGAGVSRHLPAIHLPSVPLWHHLSSRRR